MISLATHATALRSWDALKAAFDAALAVERQFEAIHVRSVVTTDEIGPDRSAQVDNVPDWVWTVDERLTDARCDAEEALIVYPAPDLTAALWKIEYARVRWQDFEEWPAVWWTAVLLDLRRLSGTQSASPLALDPTVDAWDHQRRNAIADVEGRTEADGEADALLARGNATSISGVIAKLRSCLWTIPTVRGHDFDPIATSDLPIGKFDDVFESKLARDDYPVECLWTAIRSLEAMEGL